MNSRITLANRDDSPLRWLNREVHFFHSCRPPIDLVAGLQSELANELASRPATAFTKRMSGIQLADEEGGAVDKFVGVKSNEMPLARELC